MDKLERDLWKISEIKKAERSAVKKLKTWFSFLSPCQSERFYLMYTNNNCCQTAVRKRKDMSVK